MTSRLKRTFQDPKARNHIRLMMHRSWVMSEDFRMNKVAGNLTYKWTSSQIGVLLKKANQENSSPRLSLQLHHEGCKKEGRMHIEEIIIKQDDGKFLHLFQSTSRVIRQPNYFWTAVMTWQKTIVNWRSMHNTETAAVSSLCHFNLELCLCFFHPSCLCCKWHIRWQRHSQRLLEEKILLGHTMLVPDRLMSHHFQESSKTRSDRQEGIFSTSSQDIITTATSDVGSTIRRRCVNHGLITADHLQ